MSTSEARKEYKRKWYQDNRVRLAVKRGGEAARPTVMPDPLTKEEEYEKHKAESDTIVKDLLLDAINNTLYHDALSEAQTMIGERELTISRLEQENQELRNALFMERSIVRG